jgi:hypothetical protein
MDSTELLIIAVELFVVQLLYAKICLQIMADPLGPVRVRVRAHCSQGSQASAAANSSCKGSLKRLAALAGLNLGRRERAMKGK